MASANAGGERTARQQARVEAAIASCFPGSWDWQATVSPLRTILVDGVTAARGRAAGHLHVGRAASGSLMEVCIDQVLQRS